MDFSNKFADMPSLNRSRIYNFATNKKPAELFRKDLISAMKMSDSEQLNKDDYWLILDTWKIEWENKGVQVPVNVDGLHSNKLEYKELDLPDTTDYEKPKNLIKFEMDSDFYVSNYDLDLVDLCWLESLKESEENIVISENVLASVITQFEIQCAAKMNAEKERSSCDDHVLCDVCKSPDGEDNNEMVFCDSCNICVHQACYGIQSIPSGEWHCSPCKELGSKKNVVCVLCPNIGGAFKPTSNTGQWSHVSCALWVPEIAIGDVTEMEPIMQIDQIPATRWNLLCSLCNIKQGTPIQCSEKGCKVAYHVTCAFNHKLKMKAIVEKNKVGVNLKSFCRKHSEERQKKDNCDKLKKNSPNGSLVQEIDLVINPESSLENSNLEFWQYVDLTTLSKQLLTIIREEYPTLANTTHELYLDLMYQYWKIKRYSQFGAPLIKVTTSKSLEVMQLQQRIEVLRLRVDLERIRNLSYMLIKREKMKKAWLNAHKSLIDKSMEIAERINSVDALKILKNIYKPESPTQNNEFQHHLRILENLNAIHDSIDLNNIYDNTSNELSKVKIILKRLNTLSKIERTNEMLNSNKNTKLNPYARSYSRRDDDSDSLSSDQLSFNHQIQSTHSNSTQNNFQQLNEIISTSSSTSNQYHKLSNNHNNRSYPLKSKSIPSNQRNSAHHLKSSPCNGHLSAHENSKLFSSESSKTSHNHHNSTSSIIKKHPVKSSLNVQASKISKNLRNSSSHSPKSLSKLTRTSVKSASKTQENRKSNRRISFNGTLDQLSSTQTANSKRHQNNLTSNSSNSVKHRKIPTRSQLQNTSLQLRKL